MNNNKVSLKTIFEDGILTSNPLLVSLLGLCPALAITDTFMNAVGMTFAVMFVMLLSNVVISLIRKLIPDEIRIPIFIIIVATFVTCIQLLMEAFTPELYDSLKDFIPLIVVNCIILGRAEAFASKNDVLPSAVDGISQSLGYGIAIMAMGLIREILATQSLTLSNPFNAAQTITLDLLKGFEITLFESKAGAFITIAIILAVIAVIKNAAEEKKGAK